MESAMHTQALGMIETWGVPALIAAADAAAKTADVRIATYEKADAGIVTIYVLGDVASVKTAVDAGSEAAKRVGKLLASHVIPRPDASLYAMMKSWLPREEAAATEIAPATSSQAESPDATRILAPADWSKLSVKQLRERAMALLPDFPLTMEQIGSAPKAQLAMLLAKLADEGGGRAP
ncbi:BMC domain-containing protein [Cohnella yongneupensis]|uniref:BMC domain-containing protein n=1 Tax=Cohnella yongneupensis TaxID=425006 RepID=A0ABW0QSZ8_9BACL